MSQALWQGVELRFAASCKNIPPGHVCCTFSLTCLVLLPPPWEEANLLSRPHPSEQIRAAPGSSGAAEELPGSEVWIVAVGG